MVEWLGQPLTHLCVHSDSKCRKKGSLYLNLGMVYNHVSLCVECTDRRGGDLGVWGTGLGMASDLRQSVSRPMSCSGA